MLESKATQTRTLTGRNLVKVWGAGVAFGLLLGLLASLSSSWTAAVMVAAVIALGAIYARLLGLEVGLVLLLVVASVVDRFTFRAGPIDLRAEEIAGLGALVVLAGMRLRGRQGDWLRPSVPESLLIVWFACGIASSLLASPDRRLSAKIIILVGVCSLGFFLPRRILSGGDLGERLETLVRCLLLVFATEAAYGSLAYLLHVFGPTISITANPASGHLSAYGTLWEQNVFGAFAAAGAVAWTYLGPRRFKYAWIGLAACIGGLIDSITRAAWLVAGLMGALGLAVRGLRRRLDFAALWLGALAGLAVLGATLVVDRIEVYTIPVAGGGPRAGGLLAAILNLVDAVGRFNQLGPVLEDVRGNMLLGRGTASFEALHVVSGLPEHIASLPLLVFNDTGLIGLALFTAFVIAIAFRAWSKRRSEVVAALGQVGLVVGLTNLATQTTELMVGWLLLGLLMAAADHVDPTKPPSG